MAGVISLNRHFQPNKLSMPLHQSGMAR